MPAENLATNDPDVIFTCLCEEPKRDVTRTVRFMRLSPENLRKFWEKTRQYRTIFSSEIREDYRNFAKVLLRQNSSGGLESTGLFWVVDDMIGVFYMTSIRPEVDALIHYTFLDGRLRGRTTLTKTMLQYAFNTFNFQRLTVELPMYATPKTHNFVLKSLGFKEEGRKRSAVLFDGEWFDVKVYGILKEEALAEGYLEGRSK